MSVTRRDYRCAFSGLSLFDAEVAVVIIEQAGPRWRPITLPLFGIYEGMGTVGEVHEGPNADLVLSTFQGGAREEGLVIDFQKMGLEPQPIDHIETLLSLLAVSQIQGEGALRSDGGALGFTLMSAHVAAALMAGEPRLPLERSVDDLWEVVFESQLAQSIYRPLRDQPHRLRAKFGLSLVGLAALCEQMERHGKPWVPPGEGLPLVESNRTLWLAEAMVTWADDELLVEALEEYTSQGDEEAL